MFYPQFKKVRLRAMRESLRTIQTIWRERRKARAPLVLKPQNIPVLRVRHERIGRRTVMFLWEISNNRRQAKFKTRLLLAARLFNANCILSRLFLPSLIAFARKTSSSFPQVVLPAFFSAILVGINR